MATLRQMKLGQYTLPTKAVKGLQEAGINGGNINTFKARELREVPGFGELAEKMLLAQRAKMKVNNKVRHQRAKDRGATGARNMRLHDEAKGAGIGDGRDPSRKTPSWLRMPSGGDVEPSRTMTLSDDRLVLDIGPEHGFNRRHAAWVQNFVKNAPPDMLVDSIERFMVKILRQTMADDPTKGGTIGLATVESFGEQADATPILR